MLCDIDYRVNLGELKSPLKSFQVLSLPHLNSCLHAHFLPVKNSLVSKKLFNTHYCSVLLSQFLIF